MKTPWSNVLIVAPLSWVLCTNEKAFRKILRELELPRADWPLFLGNARANACVHFIQKGDGKQYAVVAIKHNKDRTPEQHYALIAHEAVHIWQAIRDNIGEKSPSSEFEAYAVQNIVQDLLCDFREATKGKK